MKIDVILLKSDNLQDICSWNSPDFFEEITHNNNIILDVRLEIEGIQFSVISHSLYDLVLDILINTRMILSGKNFNFFLSEKPIFSVTRNDRNINFFHYDKRNNKRTYLLNAEDVDQTLSLALCHGLQLLDRHSHILANGIWKAAYDDIESENRRDFITSD